MRLVRFIGVLSLWVIIGACGGESNGTNEGNTNNDNVAVCGNGEVDGVEECDDGADNSDTRADACRTDCTEPRCGDGVSDSTEECDNGVANSDSLPDACRGGCTEPSCGDDVVDIAHGETCDDGNGVDGDGCSAMCQVEYCGNGVLDDGELCDDGNNIWGDGCSPNCQSDETCGNGIVDPGVDEICDCGLDPAMLPAGCSAINGDLLGECSADC